MIFLILYLMYLCLICLVTLFEILNFICDLDGISSDGIGNVRFLDLEAVLIFVIFIFI